MAQLYYKANRNGKNLFQFPRILDIRFKPDKTIYIFRLPHAIDPRDVRKKEYVFRSMFGENIEIKGEHTVSLTVYHNVLNGSYDYNFDEIRLTMKRYNLPIIAGKDMNGKFHCYDMTKNPHLLIAGETGSGKSVMLRSILTSLIQYFRNGGLQLHLIDLKRNEIHLFRHIDIVKAAITDKANAKRCINWFHNQLKKRGDLLDQYGLDHIDKYNSLENVNKLDYLILCIDEFSLLREEKDTMEKLIDISALSRALGIYLILSTQRPDRKVIDGLMKANLTVRYAFRHADKINSRITLGEGVKADASQIDEEDKGKFYMRFSGCHYLQSPFLSIEKAKELLSAYKIPVHERDKKENGDENENIINYEGEVTEHDIYDEIEKEHENNFAPLLIENMGGEDD